jgi:hypothetical protein
MTPEMFRARCEESAARVELTLQDAVDALQDVAIGYGLVDTIGQDTVQGIMGLAFAVVHVPVRRAEAAMQYESAKLAKERRSNETEDYDTGRFWRLCREADERQAKQPRKADHDLPVGWEAMPVGELWHRLNDPERHGVAKSTLDAAVYLVKQNDPERLRAWLAYRSAEECAAIWNHLEQRKGKKQC